jgi:hypothetical protein
VRLKTSNKPSKVALRQSTFQRVSNQSFPMLPEKLIQQVQRSVVRRTTEEILGFQPQVRVKLVASILAVVAGLPYVEDAKQPIPNAIGIGRVCSLNLGRRFVSNSAQLP